MEDDIIVIAHVNVGGGITPAAPQSLQFGTLTELSLEKREKNDWDEWVELYLRNW